MPTPRSSRCTASGPRLPGSAGGRHGPKAGPWPGPAFGPHGRSPAGCARLICQRHRQFGAPCRSKMGARRRPYGARRAASPGCASYTVARPRPAPDSHPPRRHRPAPGCRPPRPGQIPRRRGPRRSRTSRRGTTPRRPHARRRSGCPREMSTMPRSPPGQAARAMISTSDIMPRSVWAAWSAIFLAKSSPTRICVPSAGSPSARDAHRVEDRAHRAGFEHAAHTREQRRLLRDVHVATPGRRRPETCARSAGRRDMAAPSSRTHPPRVVRSSRGGVPSGTDAGRRRVAAGTGAGIIGSRYRGVAVRTLCSGRWTGDHAGKSSKP